MSAKPDVPEDLITVEIDGTAYRARKGEMIIQVADAAGVTIPRFCYHTKLPIAASCRMCLVEVERAPKPLPACATPVTDGMKVFTRSVRAIAAQKAVMEFLLINHPLDCPICDQGGECELQDLSLGFGSSVSRFAEKKRVVADRNLGPLIATDMTRCIHCTRCIRFLEVIAGQKELGGIGRGEHMRIDTYVERSLHSEMSGNVIDVCPVGALTSKPFRFTARAWELREFPAIAPHDSVGSNLALHMRRGRVMRVVPRENESINEVWLSDRDRFGYQGLYAADRLESPMIRRGDCWEDVKWDVALEFVVDGLRRVLDEHGPAGIGALVSPTATIEELYLANRLVRGLGGANIDHRLRQADFRDQDRAPPFPWLGQSIEDLENLDAALIVGSNVQHEQPIVAHRLRKATRRGAMIMFVNPVDFDFHFPVAHKIIAGPAGMVRSLAGIAKALGAGGDGEVPQVREFFKNINPGQAERGIAQALRDGVRSTVLLGNLATAHPGFSVLQALAGWIAEASGAALGYLPEAANSAGAWIAGAVPHRDAGAVAVAPGTGGLDAAAMLESPPDALILFGVEPEFDCWDPAKARRAAGAAGFTVVMSPYAGDAARDYADVLLPIAAFAETSGTFVNAEGRWQGFRGACAPYGEARPGWKVLRVLGNLLGLAGFEYTSSEQVRDELHEKAGALAPDNRSAWPDTVELPDADAGLVRIGDVPIYGTDALVRRATALQQTGHGRDATVRIRATLAQRLGLAEAARVEVMQGDARAVLPLVVDDRVPDGCAWISAALPGSAGLGPSIGPVTLRVAS